MQCFEFIDVRLAKKALKKIKERDSANEIDDYSQCVLPRFIPLSPSRIRPSRLRPSAPRPIT